MRADTHSKGREREKKRKAELGKSFDAKSLDIPSHLNASLVNDHPCVTRKVDHSTFSHFFLLPFVGKRSEKRLPEAFQPFSSRILPSLASSLLSNIRISISTRISYYSLQMNHQYNLTRTYRVSIKTCATPFDSALSSRIVLSYAMQT